MKTAFLGSSVIATTVFGLSILTREVQGRSIPRHFVSDELFIDYIVDPVENSVEVVVTLAGLRWVAIGSSPTGQMLGTTACVGLSDGNDPQLYELLGKSRDFIVPAADQNLISSSFTQINTDMEEESILKCKIPLDLPTGFAFSSTEPTPIVVAYGVNNGVSDELSYHGPYRFPGLEAPALSAEIIMESDVPSDVPSMVPTMPPALATSDFPSDVPSAVPTMLPDLVRSTSTESDMPSMVPTLPPAFVMSDFPSMVPTSALEEAQEAVSDFPSMVPSTVPSDFPSDVPSMVPTMVSDMPSVLPTVQVTGMNVCPATDACAPGSEWISRRSRNGGCSAYCVTYAEAQVRLEIPGYYCGNSCGSMTI